MSHLLPWDYHQNSTGRKVGSRGEELPAILIACEGSKSEPNYFKSFRLTSARVHIVGDGFNTLSLVEETLRIRDEAASNGRQYEQVWCVFDKDSFSNHDFNAAIERCEALGFKAAYSNEAFELWYLLHYMYCDTGLSRTAYADKLKPYLGGTYQKNDSAMYNKLLEKQGDAIKNARTLFSNQETGSPAQNNPCTTVHLLVEELNKLMR